VSVNYTALACFSARAMSGIRCWSENACTHLAKNMACWARAPATGTNAEHLREYFYYTSVQTIASARGKPYSLG
jgi:hypothetical protein